MNDRGIFVENDEWCDDPWTISDCNLITASFNFQAYLEGVLLHNDRVFNINGNAEGILIVADDKCLGFSILVLGSWIEQLGYYLSSFKATLFIA